MAVVRTKKTETFRVDSEEQATNLVEDFKSQAMSEGSSVIKTKIDYKSKKDRKTGEIVEEWWIVEITISYEI